jgi:O-antigen/teichoic acid export membrane protein
MGVILRQSIKGTLSNYLGVALGAFSMLILFPKLLEPDQIGLVRVLQDIGLLMASLSQVGAINIIDRFYPYFHDEPLKNKGFVVFIIIYPLIGFVVISGLFFLFQNLWTSIYSQKSPLLLDYFIMLIPLSFFMLYQQVLEAYARAVLRITIPIFVREVFLRITMIAFLLLYASNLISFELFVYSLIISYSLAVFILLFYLRHLKSIWIEYFNWTENKIILKEMLKYGGVIFFTGFVAVLSARIDIVMLSAVSLEITGIYAIAFFMGTVIEMPKRALSQISIPLIAKGWKNNDLQSIKDIYQKTSMAQTMIGVLMFTLLMANLKDVFNIIPNSELYVSGITVVFIIGLSRLIDMSTGLNAEVIVSSPFYKVSFYLTIFLGASNILFNSLLIPKYGMEGAAIGTLLSFSIANIIRIIIVKVKTGMLPFSFSNLLVIAIGAGILLIAYWINIGGSSLIGSLVIIGIKSCIITGVFVFISYKLKFSPDLNAFIIKTLNLKS